jgi:IS1 family transposase
VRLEHSKVVQIVKLLAEGLGVRGTARVIGCDAHTVLNVLETLGPKFEAFHNRLAVNLKTESLQLDELWSRVYCAQKNTHEDEERGDQYTFLALAAREKFIISWQTGKRNAANTDAFVADIAKRVPGRIQITTDSFRPYPAVIRSHLLPRLDYALMVKHFAATPGQTEAVRRYSPAPFVGISVKIKAGNPRRDRICTSHVERANLSVRHFNKRFARLSLGYSKTLENHRYAVALFVCAYNWCKVHSTLGCTPAVGLKLVTETWTIEKLLEEATK